ncbi:DUF481 domain-containing protein [Photobacterium sanctipauli]|uniref:DUF481 domain-containing protein n=3 Tax=Photobacterium sanctipauli TaxID=1342794 RepID=A0A2T3NA53_9GAMM|nr:DUF481 domain-containing protein [Photobacterium sanctipauli]PSW10501.1 DUF481 domain-containing protein [Photobacterium sanctipauli]
MARNILALLLLASTAAQATDDDRPTPIPPPWTSEIEFGYHALGGNSDSETLNSRVGFTYVKNQYRQTAEAKYLLAEKDGEEDKRKGQIELQSDMKINERTYVLGNANYVDDRYGPYFTDFTLSTGLGYQLIRRETFQMEVEAGPGYRHQEPNIDEIDDDDIIIPETVDELIIRGSAKFIWKPSKNVEVNARATGIGGNSNSTLETELNVTTAINDHVALKFSNSQKVNSWVPDGLKKRDSTMSVSVLFKIN